MQPHWKEFVLRCTIKWLSFVKHVSCIHLSIHFNADNYCYYNTWVVFREGHQRWTTAQNCRGIPPTVLPECGWFCQSNQLPGKNFIRDLVIREKEAGKEIKLKSKWYPFLAVYLPCDKISGVTFGKSLQGKGLGGRPGASTLHSDGDFVKLIQLCFHLVTGKSMGRGRSGFRVQRESWMMGHLKAFLERVQEVLTKQD